MSKLELVTSAYLRYTLGINLTWCYLASVQTYGKCPLTAYPLLLGYPIILLFFFIHQLLYLFIILANVVSSHLIAVFLLMLVLFSCIFFYIFSFLFFTLLAPEIPTQRRLPNKSCGQTNKVHVLSLACTQVE